MGGDSAIGRSHENSHGRGEKQKAVHGRAHEDAERQSKVQEQHGSHDITAGSFNESESSSKNLVDADTTKKPSANFPGR
jgi:hypothetical protein